MRCDFVVALPLLRMEELDNPGSNNLLRGVRLASLSLLRDLRISLAILAEKKLMKNKGKTKDEHRNQRERENEREREMKKRQRRDMREIREGER